MCPSGFFVSFEIPRTPNPTHTPREVSSGAPEKPPPTLCRVCRLPPFSPPIDPLKAPLGGGPGAAIWAVRKFRFGFPVFPPPRPSSFLLPCECYCGLKEVQGMVRGASSRNLAPFVGGDCHSFVHLEFPRFQCGLMITLIDGF